MKPLVLRPLADLDIDNYYIYIKNENPQAAMRFIDSLQATFANIGNFSAIGSLRFNHLTLLEKVRVINVKNFANYQIFYIERDNHIEVIRILHSSMDISQDMLNAN